MAERSKAMPFGPDKSGTANKSLPQKGSKSPKIKKAKTTSSSQQAIPKPVANRMLRRVILLRVFLLLQGWVFLSLVI